MTLKRQDEKILSPEEIEHLEIVKTVVETALEDGEFSVVELDRIKSIIWADGKVTYEELRTVHETIISVMGGLPPSLEWIKGPG